MNSTTKTTIMKSSGKALLLLGIFTIALQFTSLAQETVVITLNVNTAVITNQNAYQVSTFDGQADGTDTREFTVYVNPGDVIIWKGVSINAPETDVVNIKSINYQGGKNVFNSNVLNGNGENPELVMGTVINGTQGFEEKYNISFTVYNNGQKRQGTFHIDPKIKVKE